MFKQFSRFVTNSRACGLAILLAGLLPISAGCKSPVAPPVGVSQPVATTGSLADNSAHRLVDFAEMIESSSPIIDAETEPEDMADTAHSEPPAEVRFNEEHYVTIALSSHPRIRAARQKVSAAINRVPQQIALPDPMFSNTFWPFHDQAIQTAAGRVGNQMSISQGVPWPKKLRARAAVASKEIQIAKAEVATVERQIAESVRLAYYELWFASRASEIVDQNRALVDKLVTVAKARFRSGGRLGDVERANLEADKLEDQIIRLRRQKQVAQADLAALLQQPIDFAPEAEQDLQLRDLPTQLEELIAQAESCNPSLRGLAWQIQRDRQQRQVACLEHYPDLNLGLGWGLVNDQGAISPVADSHDTLGLTVGVTLPIWKDKINAGIREADANISSSIQLHQATRDELFGKVRRLFAQAEALVEQLRLYEDRIIPRTQKTLRFAEADYRGERADFLEVIEVYQELLMYRLQVARTKSTLAGTLAQIERVTGCSVTVVR